MMKLGGISAVKEAANFLIDKVGEPYITRYTNHIAFSPNYKTAQHAIIPDFHVFNFPAGCQTINNSGATTSAEAIFEIKPYSPCKSSYNHNNNNTTPADRRTHDITLEYTQKFKKLDVVFASEVVVGEHNATTGPFISAQNHSYRGQIIPIVAGAFGNTNKDFGQNHLHAGKRSLIGRRWNDYLPSSQY